MWHKFKNLPEELISLAKKGLIEINYLPEENDFELSLTDKGMQFAAELFPNEEGVDEIDLEKFEKDLDEFSSM
jgi:DNA-binding MarR family transcriptional regulator